MSLLSLAHPVYSVSPRKGWGGYTRRVTLLNVLTSHDGLRLMRKLLPDVSKAQFKALGLEHARRAREHTSAWSDRVDLACRTTFGRPFEFTDYRISGIAREEFSEEDKNLLRLHSRRSSLHRQLAILYLMAAGHRHYTAQNMCRE